MKLGLNYTQLNSFTLSRKKDYSFTVWMLMGFWLIMVASFLDENYMFHALELDDFEVRSWTVMALFITASGCFIAAIVKSIGKMNDG